MTKLSNFRIIGIILIFHAVVSVRHRNNKDYGAEVVAQLNGVIASDTRGPSEVQIQSSAKLCNDHNYCF